jgi:fumarylacetoacetate (FAA) hydrolase family protein
MATRKDFERKFTEVYGLIRERMMDSASQCAIGPVLRTVKEADLLQDTLASMTLGSDNEDDKQFVQWMREQREDEPYKLMAKLNTNCGCQLKVLSPSDVKRALGEG